MIVIKPLLIPICECPENIVNAKNRFSQFASWSKPIHINDTTFAHELPVCQLIDNQSNYYYYSFLMGTVLGTLIFWVLVLLYYKKYNQDTITRITSKM